MNGNVSGGITGRHVDFTIRWDNGPRGHYTGDVGGDDFVHNGFSRDEANPGSSASWDSTVPFVCLDAPPPAAPAPAPAPQAPAQPSATVISDVDVYDVKNVPDGTGTVIGVLTAGTQVNVVGTCKPEDWCNVSGPAVPGGKGWIWGALQLP